jgi:hypothetical protein
MYAESVEQIFLCTSVCILIVLLYTRKRKKETHTIKPPLELVAVLSIYNLIEKNMRQDLLAFQSRAAGKFRQRPESTPGEDSFLRHEILATQRHGGGDVAALSRSVEIHMATNDANARVAAAIGNISTLIKEFGKASAAATTIETEKDC